MKSEQTKHSSRKPGNAERDLIEQLQRLYGGKSAKPDLFGRRLALPSEVAAWLAAAGRQAGSD